MYFFDSRRIDDTTQMDSGYQKATAYALLHLRMLGLVRGSTAHEYISEKGRAFIAAEATRSRYVDVFSREILPFSECARVTHK